MLLSRLFATDPQHRVGPGLLRRRLGLVVFGPIALAIFWKAGELLPIPQNGSYSGSLLAGSGMPALWAVLVLLVALTCVYALAIGRIATDLPTACAAIGLAALSWRGGTMRDTLIASAHREIYLTLIGEMLLLYAGIAVSKTLSALVLGDRFPPRGSEEAARPGVAGAVAVHALVVLLLVMFLARSDSKQQVMAAIFIASVVGSVAARVVGGAASATSCWLGPMIAGIIGYLAAYVSATDGLMSIGQSAGYLAPLARALPIDYASIGTAGAIIGFWWARDMEAPAEADLPTAESGGQNSFNAA